MGWGCSCLRGTTGNLEHSLTSPCPSLVNKTNRFTSTVVKVTCGELREAYLYLAFLRPATLAIGSLPIYRTCLLSDSAFLSSLPPAGVLAGLCHTRGDKHRLTWVLVIQSWVPDLHKRLFCSSLNRMARLVILLIKSNYSQKSV